MMEAETPAATPERLTASPLRLMAKALGPPRVWAGKLAGIRPALAGWADIALGGRRLRAKLKRLRAEGIIDVEPTPLQVTVGAIDMLRFWIVPAARDYYEQQGIDFRFHQVLRVLDDPGAMLDPIGLFVSAERIGGHVMQVVHANPLYDMQLLGMHPDGVRRFRDDIAALIAGTHPRTHSIRAIVEDVDYHRRLLGFVERFLDDPRTTEPLVRANIRGRFDRIEAFFGTLDGTMRYFARLPTTIDGAVRHLRTVTTFDEALAHTATSTGS
jgi:hypothetical protein